jgi:hypothetical protein
MAPVRDGVVVHAHDRGDLAVGQAVGGQQHDLGSFGGPLGVVWARTRRCSSTRSVSVITSGGMVGMAAAPRRGDEQPSYANN